MKAIKIIFFGTPDFAIPALRELAENFSIEAVITQPDQPKGRKKILSAPPVKEYAMSRDFFILQPEKLDEDLVDRLNKIKPDLAVVVAYGKILPKAIIDLPKFGCLNIHASLLPKYRGASPIQAALRHGDKQTGVTIMKIDEGLDTGDILAQSEIDIKKADDLGTLHDLLAELGARSIVKVVTDYLAGKIKPQKQDDQLASVFPTISKGQGRIAWTNSAEHIFNQIRAFTPWPGAFTYFKNKKLDIIKADFLSSNGQRPIGLVFKKDGNVAIQTGLGCLILIKLKLEGKNEVDIASFVNGHADFIGTTLK
ncbi:MAG: methionyl-tRNA formyltransferase [Patescibacteria group bacterium]